MPPAIYRRMLAGLAAIALACAGVLLGAVPAHAATHTVTDLSDTSTPGTLRYALENLTPGGPNTIDITVKGDIVVGATDLPDITEPVTITGPGEANLRIVTPGFGFVITGMDIPVTISDLSIVGAPSPECGIDSADANLTLERITITEFDCSGVFVDGGALVATDVTVNDNGNGLAHYGYDATDTLTLTRIVALDNDFQGVFVALTDTVASIDSVTTTNGLFGFVYGSSNSTATISGVRADGAAGYGITVVSGDGSNVNLLDSSAGSVAPAATSTGTGFELQASDGSTLIATRLTATDHEGGGISLNATTGSRLEVNGSLSQSNGESGPCGCFGGGIIINTSLGSASDSAISITGTRVLDNFATAGAGVFLGLLESDSTLTISDSVISGNQADTSGGAFYAQDIGFGAAVGPVAFVRTTMSGNSADTGGAVQVDGFSHTTSGAPALLFDSSTISGNTATTGGGGIFVTKMFDSGGLGIVRVVNTTISGNSSPGPGSGLAAVATSGLSTDEMRTEVLHSTIASNTGDIGATFLGAQSVAFSHTIVADNPVGDLLVAIDDPALFDIEYSLVEAPQSPAIPAAPGNLVGVDPQFGPLANNGGPTMTHLIAPGSPAYNAGNPAITGAPAYDQRGLARIYQTIDMGAVEWHPVLAATGSEPEPEPGLLALLMLFSGIALVAASRRFAL